MDSRGPIGSEKNRGSGDWITQGLAATNHKQGETTSVMYSPL